MLEFFTYFLIYFGAALMVFNIVGFILFAKTVIKSNAGNIKKAVLFAPIVLLIFFLIGYLLVAIFGKPDILFAGILSGGSVFVFIMYILLRHITKKIIEHEERESKHLIEEESRRAKSAFFSDVSHEMRTPMNVIIGLDAVVLKDKSLSKETREHIKHIDFNAKHLLGLINNIIDINSAETGEFKAKNDLLSLQDIAKQIGEIASSQCEDKGLGYACSVSPDISSNYLGDEIRIKQILGSLLHDAICYTGAPGNVTLNVALGKHDGERDWIVFSVSETSEDTQEKSKKDDTLFSRGGSDIGLTATKSIASLLGGFVKIESEESNSLSFTLTLPLAIPSEKHDIDDEISLSGKRVLIVEDIPDNAEIVADLLDLEGAITEHAENGRIGLEMFANSPDHYYDAILMDLRRPEMDGLTASREIRKLNKADAKTIPIIALSANALESDIQESIASGMNAHLAKPAEADMLYGAIKKVLRETQR